MITKSILGEHKEFQSKDSLLAYVKENLNQIIDFKKSVEQKSVDKGIAVSCKVLNGIKMNVSNKSIIPDKDYWYIAVNTTRILDNHDDLHVNGIWNKTITEQQGKNYLVDAHELKINSTIVRKEYIQMFLANVSFSSLGMPYNGDTEVLVYKFRKDKVTNQSAKEWLESGDAIQASVRMQYIGIKFALDSNAPEDKEAKKNYDEYYPIIANKSDFDYIPYFFIINEAKNIRESSLVPFGSNYVTGNISENTEPENSTQNKSIEPSKNTQMLDELNKLLTKF